MAFSIRCPQCGARLTAKSDELVGKKLPCPKCKQVFVVQKPEPARAAPAGEEPDDEVHGVARSEDVVPGAATPGSVDTGSASPAAESSLPRAPSRPVAATEERRVSLSPAMISAIAGGSLAVVAIVVVGVWLLFSGGDADEVAGGDPGGATTETEGKTDAESEGPEVPTDSAAQVQSETAAEMEPEPEPEIDDLPPPCEPPDWGSPWPDVEPLATEHGKTVDFWLERLESGDPNEVTRALSALGVYRSQAERVLPALVQNLSPTNTAARDAILWLRPSADQLLPLVTPLLEDPEAGPPREIVRVLGPEALPLLPKLLEDVQRRKRAAGYAREAIGAMGGAAVPELIERLAKDDRAERLAAIAMLEAIGPEAKDAAPQLVGLVRPNDAAFFGAATRALARVAPEDKAFRQKLVEAIKDQKLQRLVVEAVVLMERPDPELAEVIRSINGSNRSAGDWIQKAMLASLPRTPESVAKLLRLREEGTLGQSAVISDMIPFIKSTGAGAHAVLIDHLDDADPGVRQGAVFLISALKVRSAGPALLERASKTRNADEFKSLVNVAARVRAPADRLVSLLGPASPLIVSTRRTAALNVATWSGDHTAEPAVRLLQQVKDKPEEWPVVWSLLKFGGPKAKAAVPELLRQMKNLPDNMQRIPRYRTDVLGILTSIGRPAVPALVELFGSDAVFKQLVLLALGEMGHEAEGALPLLEGLREDPNPAISGTAQRAEVSIRWSLLRDPLQGLDEEPRRRMLTRLVGLRRRLATDLLRPALQSDDELLREAAWRTLAQRWSSLHPPIVSAAERELLAGFGNCPDVATRRFAAIVLFVTGDDSEPVRSAVSGAMDAGDYSARLTQLAAFSQGDEQQRQRVRELVKPYVPVIVERIRQSPYTHPLVISLLLEMAPDSFDAVEHMLRHGQQTPPPLLGPVAWEAVPRLVRQLKSTAENVDRLGAHMPDVAAAPAVWSILRDDRAVTHLVSVADALRDKELFPGPSGTAKIYVETLKALDSLGDQAPPTMPYWTRALRQRDPGLQVAAARDLWNSRPSAETAEVIIHGLGLDRRLTWEQRGLLERDELWDLLLAFGEHASPARPGLESAATYPVAKVRREAHRTSLHLNTPQREPRE